MLLHVTAEAMRKRFATDLTCIALEHCSLVGAEVVETPRATLKEWFLPLELRSQKLLFDVGDDAENVFGLAPTVDMSLIVRNLKSTVATDSGDKMQPLPPFDLAKSDITHFDARKRKMQSASRGAIRLDRGHGHKLPAFDATLHRIAMRTKLHE